MGATCYIHVRVFCVYYVDVTRAGKNLQSMERMLHSPPALARTHPRRVGIELVPTEAPGQGDDRGRAQLAVVGPLRQDRAREELDRRLDDLESEGPRGIPWDEVLDRLESKN